MTTFLGQAESLIRDHSNVDAFTNVIGNAQTWLRPLIDESNDSYRTCPFCRRVMYPLTQVYAPMGEYHRTLYVFACSRMECLRASLASPSYRRQWEEKDSTALRDVAREGPDLSFVAYLQTQFAPEWNMSLDAFQSISPENVPEPAGKSPDGSPSCRDNRVHTKSLFSSGVFSSTSTNTEHTQLSSSLETPSISCSIATPPELDELDALFNEVATFTKNSTPSKQTSSVFSQIPTSQIPLLLSRATMSLSREDLSPRSSSEQVAVCAENELVSAIDSPPSVAQSSSSSFRSRPKRDVSYTVPAYFMEVFEELHRCAAPSALEHDSEENTVCDIGSRNKSSIVRFDGAHLNILGDDDYRDDFLGEEESDDDSGSEDTDYDSHVRHQAQNALEAYHSQPANDEDDTSATWENEEYEVTPEEYQLRFLSRIRKYPAQCIRWNFGLRPLWSSYPVLEREAFRTLQLQGYHLEIQILPQILEAMGFLGKDDIDFGSIFVFTPKDSTFSSERELLLLPVIVQI